MSGAGDNLIDTMIQQGIDSTKEPSAGQQVCSAHEPIRTGVYALLLDAQDRRKASSFDMGPIHATGWSGAVLMGGYLIAKAKGWVP